MSSARSKPALARLDWIRAGQELLIEGGISSVKLAALTRRLGVTSGSFYHHFSGFRDYLHSLADYYGGENVDRLIEILRTALVELGFSHGEARIRALLAFAAGVGQPFRFGRPSQSDDAAAALEIVLRP